jgi:hypothetical protein
MAEEYAHTAKFHGASFRESDLHGATFRDCDLRHVKITSSAVDDMRISGFDGRAGTVVVDDVVITDFVAAELDRRHPERVQLREMRTADDYRVMWATLERLWSDTLARAEALPEDVRHERVDGEWSFVEMLRHLVFAIDSWVGRMVLGEPAPYHRLALPHTDFPAEAPAQIGIELDARPSYSEIVAVYAARRGQVRGIVEASTDGELGQIRTGTLTPGWDEESFPVGECLRVALREHCEHRRYAVRDLAVLEARVASLT